MASYESIGSCSLDVDVTAGDSASEVYGSGSVSERTLHSLNLSTRTPDTDLSNPAPSGSTHAPGSTTPEYVKRTARLFQDDALSSPPLAEIFVNGSKHADIVTKKPSYLALACSLSGYTTITNYDSKLREGFRSRDQSPGRLVIRSRDVSPLKFNQDHIDSATSRCRSYCGNFLVAPGAGNNSVDRLELNGETKDGRTLMNSRLANGVTGKDITMTENSTRTVKESSSRFMSTMLSTNSYSSTSCEVSSSFQTSNFDSPVRSAIRNGAVNVNGTNGTNGSLNVPESGVPLKRSPGAIRVTEFTSQAKSYVHNDSKSTYSTAKFSESKSQFLESKPHPNETRSVFAESKCLTGTNENGRGYTNENGRAYSNGSAETTSVWTGSAVSNKSFIQQRVERLYGPGALAQGFFRRTSNGQLQQQTQQMSPSPCEADTLPSKQASLPVLRHLRPEFRAQLALNSRKAVEVDPTSSSKIQVPVLQQQLSVESVTDILPAAPEVVLPIDQTVVDAGIEGKEGVGEVKDGAYFLKVLKDEIDIINAMVLKTEQDMEGRKAGSMPEEAEGKVRAVIGQARLLVKQKLQQFEGLCHKNMAQSSEEQFPTTADDLAGFWDMVKLQVCQVHKLFQDLDKLKAANWKEEEVVLTDVVDSNTAPKRRSIGATKRSPKPTANEEARKAREEARRKMMEDRRREMREKNKNKGDSVEIFVPQENGN